MKNNVTLFCLIWGFLGCQGLFGQGSMNLSEDENSVRVVPNISIITVPVESFRSNMFVPQGDSTKVFTISPFQSEISFSLEFSSQGSFLASQIDSLSFEVYFNLSVISFLKPSSLYFRPLSVFEPHFTFKTPAIQSDTLFVINTSRIDSRNSDLVIADNSISNKHEPGKFKLSSSNIVQYGGKRQFEPGPVSFDRFSLISGGLLVLVQEVIDPADTIVVFIRNLMAFDSDGGAIPLVVSGQDSALRIFGKETDLDSSQLFYIQEVECSPSVPCKLNYFKSPSGFNTFSPAFRTFSNPDKIGGSAMALCWNDDGSLVLQSSESDCEGSGFLGYVSTSYQPGLLPLFHAKRNCTSCSSLCQLQPTSRYSFCLTQLLLNACFDSASILCYVIPPHNNHSPCPE